MNPLQDLPDNLLSRIVVSIRQHPELADLFRDIATYISTLTGPIQTNGHAPPSKKRKLEVEASIADTYDSIADVSFSIPQRKKLKLEIGRNSEIGAIRGTSAATGEAEFGIRYIDVDYCICLPVPEKAQPQYSFCVLPSSGDDQLLFSVPGTKIKPEAVHSDQPVDEEQSYKDVVIKMLSKRLKKIKVIEPNEKDFVSTIAQAHRKGEKAVHVKAFRGSKDGKSYPQRFYLSSAATMPTPPLQCFCLFTKLTQAILTAGFLFFLPTGIIFAFKKPLLFYPFHSIASISYTSVLQRTFNLNINVYSSSPANTHYNTSSNPGTETHEIEFSMIDQADFAGIDAYIKRRNLQDASMAEQRRAQKYNVNGTNNTNDGGGGEAEGEEEGELQKAQREADDMEDEDEEEDENFDPGSEGESEGSGSGSEEEDGGNVDADGNLVETELGSEAEDVSE
ncbi:MAG: hypothetical protein L6R38_007346 [Xanthoria sp. 2 TBL-2021]|nr:MAG: hypothetical protein L6R38_007346 [Xanthoria sp. 2 TBL-2021]